MKIFIGCSSSDNIDAAYIESCKDIIDSLMKNTNELLFGAMNEGIMGLSYKIAKGNNIKITGIAPEYYKSDFKHLECDNEIITAGVSERTETLIKKADAVLFLPGGIGTMYEIFAAIEMKRSKEIDKPIIIYNCLGFFDDFIIMLDKIYKENFTRREVQSLYYVVTEVHEAVNYINNYFRNWKYYIYAGII